MKKCQKKEEKIKFKTLRSGFQRSNNQIITKKWHSHYIVITRTSIYTLFPQWHFRMYQNPSRVPQVTKNNSLEEGTNIQKKNEK